MDRQWKVLVASSDKETHRRIVQMLDRFGVDMICASTISQCRRILGIDNVGLAFCDRALDDGGYREVLDIIDCNPSRRKVRVVLMSSIIPPEEYEAAKQAGVFQVISSPCRPTDVEWMLIVTKRAERARIQQLIRTSLKPAQTFAN
jgi:CheY-like chemotaxis protein